MVMTGSETMYYLGCLCMICAGELDHVYALSALSMIHTVEHSVGMVWYGMGKWGDVGRGGRFVLYHQKLPDLEIRWGDSVEGMGCWVITRLFSTSSSIISLWDRVDSWIIVF